ncbi:hypothetical protein [Halopseudomonas aestusnigri]|uniref:DUF4145 domain-containing protein n=1 Tax=Halopseudomonas aestusnigri TaxID=857252 RepID=A0AAQ1JRK9_9GAMM|nr:hypothetical protein [Halopseudomonas aestusnigri]OWL83345.1 hypothetical protein B7O88_17270 [Halopseudomonas aestusnigri]SEG73477.1 hypothetical protein SAMN05216586_12027 [Halopseudomonas aestusnigri]
MKLNKMNVARRQLEVAIELFLADGDLISIITLAGAAEEIFGKISIKADKENSLSLMVRTHKTLGSTATEKELIKHANLVRNSLKHANDEGDEEIEFDERQEAISMLSRALTNYFRVSIGDAIPLMERVYKHLHRVEDA